MRHKTLNVVVVIASANTMCIINSILIMRALEAVCISSMHSCIAYILIVYIYIRIEARIDAVQFLSTLRKSRRFTLRELPSSFPVHLQRDEVNCAALTDRYSTHLAPSKFTYVRAS